MSVERSIAAYENAQKADDDERERMVALAATEGKDAVLSVCLAGAIAERRLSGDNWHAETQVLRALMRHAVGLHRWSEQASMSADRLQAELAVRSRECGEAVMRAEKAEKAVEDGARRFEMQRMEILRLQKEIQGTRTALRAAATTN